MGLPLDELLQAAIIMAMPQMRTDVSLFFIFPNDII
jgi:hypothetical protein